MKEATMYKNTEILNVGDKRKFKSKAGEPPMKKTKSNEQTRNFERRYQAVEKKLEQICRHLPGVSRLRTEDLYYTFFNLQTYNGKDFNLLEGSLKIFRAILEKSFVQLSSLASLDAPSKFLVDYIKFVRPQIEKLLVISDKNTESKVWYELDDYMELLIAFQKDVLIGKLPVAAFAAILNSKTFNQKNNELQSQLQFHKVVKSSPSENPIEILAQKSQRPQPSPVDVVSDAEFQQVFSELSQLLDAEDLSVPDSMYNMLSELEAYFMPVVYFLATENKKAVLELMEAIIKVIKDKIVISINKTEQYKEILASIDSKKLLKMSDYFHQNNNLCDDINDIRFFIETLPILVNFNKEVTHQLSSWIQQIFLENDNDVLLQRIITIKLKQLELLINIELKQNKYFFEQLTDFDRKHLDFIMNISQSEVDTLVQKNQSSVKVLIDIYEIITFFNTILVRIEEKITQGDSIITGSLGDMQEGYLQVLNNISVTSQNYVSKMSKLKEVLAKLAKFESSPTSVFQSSKESLIRVISDYSNRLVDNSEFDKLGELAELAERVRGANESTLGILLTEFQNIKNPSAQETASSAFVVAEQSFFNTANMVSQENLTDRELIAICKRYQSRSYLVNLPSSVRLEQWRTDFTALESHQKDFSPQICEKYHGLKMILEIPNEILLETDEIESFFEVNEKLLFEICEDLCQFRKIKLVDHPDDNITELVAGITISREIETSNANEDSVLEWTAVGL